MLRQELFKTVNSEYYFRMTGFLPTSLESLKAPLRLMLLMAVMFSVQLSNAHHDASLAHAQDVCEVCVHGSMPLAVAPELQTLAPVPNLVSIVTFQGLTPVTTHSSCYHSRAPPLVLN